MIKRIAGFVLLWLPFSAFAALGDSGWISLGANDVQIISDGNPRAFIYTTVNNAGCTSTIPELVMDSTNPLASSMYATLLTGKATGQTVDIQTSGCTRNGYPIVISIHLGS
jgi:hypothetical protein